MAIPGWPNRSRWCAALLLLSSLTLTAKSVGAASLAPRVALVTGTASGVELAKRDGGYVGGFDIVNAGKTPLRILRVALRGDADDVVSPPHISIEWGGTVGETVTLAAGEVRHVRIAWMPDSHPRAREAWGAVVVTTDDETVGEVAVGFRGSVCDGEPCLDPSPTAIVGLPLLGALATFAARRRRDGRLARRIASWTVSLVLVVTVLLAGVFPSGLTRADGNDGLSFIERSAVWRGAGIEYFLGVDAVSLGFALALACLWACRVDGSRAAAERGGEARLLLLAGLFGVLFAHDLALLVSCGAVASGALVPLLRTSRGPASAEDGALRGERFVPGLAVALVALGAFVLHAKGGRTFLEDGTTSLGTWALPELRRGGDVTFGSGILSVNEIAFVVLFAPLLLLVPVPPMHRWLLGLVRSADAPSLELVAVVTVLGPVTLLRILTSATPDAFVRLSRPLGWLWLAAASYSIYLARRAPGLRERIALLTVAVANLDLVLCAAASPAAIGLALSRSLGRMVAASLALSLSVPAPRLGSTRVALAMAVLALGGLPPSLAAAGAVRAFGLLYGREPLLAGGFAILATAVALVALAIVRDVWGLQLAAPQASGASAPLSPFGRQVRLLSSLVLIAGSSAPVWAPRMSSTVADWIHASP